MALAPLRLTIPYDASFQRAPAPLMQSLNEIEWIVAGIGLLAALMFFFGGSTIATGSVFRTPKNAKRAMRGGFLRDRDTHCEEMRDMSELKIREIPDKRIRQRQVLSLALRSRGHRLTTSMCTSPSMPVPDATSGAKFGAFGGSRSATESAYYAKPQFWLGGTWPPACRGVAELFRHGELRL
jgi:hypothetical protein